jgi:hypothetical protein
VAAHKTMRMEECTTVNVVAVVYLETELPETELYFLDTVYN